MTHAYLHQMYGGRIKPHGKEFQAKILELNIKLDLDITATHSFFSWWRCDGICKKDPLHFYGYLSGIDEEHLFDSNPKGVASHAALCGGTFHKCFEPSSEIMCELRRVKRKRKSLIVANTLQENQCDKKSDNSTSRHEQQPAPKKSRVIRYSTGEE